MKRRGEQRGIGGEKINVGLRGVRGINLIFRLPRSQILKGSAIVEV